MNQDQFVVRRQERWEELAAILRQVQQKGPRHLPLPMVERLGQLYRQTASDLAYARTYFPGSSAAGYLNQLVGQAHSLIYAEEPQRLRTLMRFFGSAVPQMIRAHARLIWLAMGLMIAGGLIGYIAVTQDPNLAEALVPKQVLQRVVSPEERFNVGVGQRPLFGTLIMLNNIRVGIFAFALGVTAGLGTAVVLLFNGIMLGAVAAQAVQTGDTYTFWGFIAAHGTLELMAIFLCGAAGFALGWSIVTPGNLSRVESATLGARRAVTLVMGSIPFFIVAAIIEGWVTPMTGLSPGGKYLVGLGTGLAGLAYWAYAGRTKAAPAP